jgi:uncharacterized protein (TIGR00295 family)
MNSYPSPDECLKFLTDAGCAPEVISHCKAVRDVALRIADKTDADIKLVEAGALLHDIGRSKTHGIKHAVEGSIIGKKLGLPNEIVLIIERHIGAGLTKDEARKLGLPAKDYFPISLEEKIVCHADNLIDNSHIRPIELEVERALREGHDEYARRLVILHKELSDICGIDVNNI